MTDQKDVHWCGTSVPSGVTHGEHIPHTNCFQAWSARPAQISSSCTQPGVFSLASSPAVRRHLVLTFLFLGAVGLQCTWDLRGYAADGLALLTGRRRAYSNRYTEVFLPQIARVDGAERFTEMLGSWATHLWHPTEAAAEAEHAHALQALTCYVDGHRKPVYSGVMLPRGLVGHLGVILGCRAPLLLHDAQGHPLFVSTHRGDQHLTAGVPALLERYEQQVQTSHVARMIVDYFGCEQTELLVQQVSS